MPLVMPRHFSQTYAIFCPFNALSVRICPPISTECLNICRRESDLNIYMLIETFARKLIEGLQLFWYMMMS